MSKLAWLNFTQKIDETIFNRGDCVSPDYCGARWMTLLPVLAGIAGGVYSFFYNGFAKVTDSEFSLLQYYVLIIWFLNQLFYIRHVFILPGFWRKFFYPVFVTVVTVVTLALTLYLVFLTLWIITIFAVLIILAIFGDGGGRRRVLVENYDGTFTEYRG